MEGSGQRGTKEITQLLFLGCFLAQLHAKKSKEERANSRGSSSAASTDTVQQDQKSFWGPHNYPGAEQVGDCQLSPCTPAN